MTIEVPRLFVGESISNLLIFAFAPIREVSGPPLR